MPIHLAEPDESWPAAYRAARAELFEALGADAFVAFEHIGSTSVPGLAAKPLIDMMAAVTSLDEVDRMVEPIERLGYTYLEMISRVIPGRRFFERRRPEGEPSEHLHIVVHGEENWRRHLAFRDWLRSHPEDRVAYERLKRELAARYEDTKDYSEAKTAFIREIEARAQR